MTAFQRKQRKATELPLRGLNLYLTCYKKSDTMTVQRERNCLPIGSKGKATLVQQRGFFVTFYPCSLTTSQNKRRLKRQEAEQVTAPIKERKLPPTESTPFLAKEAFLL